MNLQDSDVCERLKNLGFRKANRLKLYGHELAILSDPILTDESAFVDLQDENSKQTRRVPIPRTSAKWRGIRPAKRHSRPNVHCRPGLSCQLCQLTTGVPTSKNHIPYIGDNCFSQV